MTEEVAVIYDENWGRLTRVSGELGLARMFDIIRAGGCCAYKARRKRCGAELKPNSPIFLGQSNLIFLSHTAGGPVPIPGSGPDMRAMVSLFCERHQGNPMLDMSRVFRRSQEKEQKKFIAMGARRAWFGV